MIDTSYDSGRQTGLSSVNLVRVGLSSLVHSFRLSAQHLTCLPRFLRPSRVPCSTVLARLLWQEMWPNHASFLLFTAPNRFSCCMSGKHIRSDTELLHSVLIVIISLFSPLCKLIFYICGADPGHTEENEDHLMLSHFNM